MNTVSTFPSAAEVAALSGADLDHALVAIEHARREVEAAYVAVLDRADTTNRSIGVLARTDAQRRFDALHSIFLGAVSAPPGSVAPEPVVNLLMTVDEYDERLAGVVIDLGRKRRFTGSARVAVILSRRRCLWPGCGRNSTRNQIDHTHEHSRGGLTTSSNGGPACGRHNRTKNGGYTVHRDADGNWHVHRPDGSELTEPAAA